MGDRLLIRGDTNPGREVGIPKGASEAQINQINKAVEYAKSLGIEMNVRVVK